MPTKITLTGPRVLRIEEDELRPPTANEVSCQTLAVGICGSDKLAYRGLMPWVTYPHVLGHEVVARTSTGDLVAIMPYTPCGVCLACQLGQPNVCVSNRTFGVQREGLLREAFNIGIDHLLYLPLGAEPVLFTLTEPLAVVYHMLERGQIGLLPPDSPVVVFGAGNLGDLLTRLLARSGWHVIGVSTTPGGRARLTKAGATEAIPAQELQGVASLRIFEASGRPEALEDAIELAFPTATIVACGHSKRLSYVAETDLVRKEINLLGSRNAKRPDFQRAIEELVAYPVFWKLYVSEVLLYRQVVYEMPRIVDGVGKVVVTL